jgi:outer membrane murein-binding lipoprotein Lpp
MKRLTTVAVASLLLMAGCSSSDPTASDEYQALEQELASATSQLAAVTAERDTLAVEVQAIQATVADTEIPAEILDIVHGFKEAVDTYDIETMQTYITDDFSFESFGVVNDRDAYVALVANDYQSGHFSVRSTGDAMGDGHARTFVVAEPTLVVYDGSSGLYGFTITTLTETLDGTWLIEKSQFVGAPVSHG